MVRYARSKGSKASNERRFEDATPWQVMRNQMIAAQNRVFQKVDCVSAVQEKQRETKISTTWAPFDVPENKSEKKLKKHSLSAEISQTSVKDKSKKNKSMRNETLCKVEDNANKERYESDISTSWPSNDWNDSDRKMIKKSKKHSFRADDECVKPKTKKYMLEENFFKGEDYVNVDSLESSSISNDCENSCSNITKKSKEHSFQAKDEYVKPKKKKSMQNEMIHNVEDQANMDSHKMAISGSCVPNDCDDSKSSVSRKSKKQSFLAENECDKPKRRKHYNECKTETDSTPEINSDSLNSEAIINSKVEAESNMSFRNEETYCSKNFQYDNEFNRNKLRKKAPKFERNERNRDRKREYKTVEFIGGREVEIYYFDGFPVMKEDWERLVELKENMLKNGVSEDEVRAALKLERRRAEKALSRQRKKVCFHCRESGHLLSDCPTLSAYDSLSSKKGNILESRNAEICFKCGSTEHSYLKCKLGERENFKFASCFICGEQGHISRQCPENPRGMYPKGGACRACGDVTHLMRDCPKYQEEQQQGAVTLPTLKDEAALEDLEVDAGRQKISKTVRSGKKVVKF